LSIREVAGAGEPVHILAYYGMCGPSRPDELYSMLLNIRDGRYLRAKNMLAKLNRLKVPIKWEHLTKISGEGVAPGRLHVARAMVEAGYVENVRQAFNKYLGYASSYAFMPRKIFASITRPVFFAEELNHLLRMLCS
jgi:predicted metal-dependent phosphoesterase TrpH